MIGIAGVVVVAYRRGAEDAPVILPMGINADLAPYRRLAAQAAD